MNQFYEPFHLWTDFFQTVHNCGPFCGLIFHSPFVQQPEKGELIYELIYEPIGSPCALRIKTNLNWHEQCVAASSWKHTPKCLGEPL